MVKRRFGKFNRQQPARELMMDEKKKYGQLGRIVFLILQN